MQQPDYSGMYPYSFDVPQPSYQPASPLPPQDPYNTGRLAAQDEAAKQAYFQSLMDTQVPYQQPGPMPGLSKQQGWIAGGLGLISALSGPNGNAPGVVGNYVKQQVGRNTDQWQRALDSQKEQRQAEVDRRKLKAQIAQLDYEDKAREHGQAVTFKHQDTRDEQLAKREAEVKRIALEGDPDYQKVLLNKRLMDGHITEDQWYKLMIPLVGRDPFALAELQRAKASFTAGPLTDKTNTEGALNTAKATDIVETRPSRVKVMLAKAGLDIKKAEMVDKELSVFDEKTAVELAKARAQTEKTLRPSAIPGEKPPSVAAQRAAINSELSVVKAQIKALEAEAKQPPGSKLGTGVGSAVSRATRLAPLQSRQAELLTQLGLLNQSVTVPKGRMQGFVPVNPLPSQIAPEKLQSAADALDRLGL